MYTIRKTCKHLKCNVFWIFGRLFCNPLARRRQTVVYMTVMTELLPRRLWTEPIFSVRWCGDITRNSTLTWTVLPHESRCLEFFREFLTIISLLMASSLICFLRRFVSTERKYTNYETWLQLICVINRQTPGIRELGYKRVSDVTWKNARAKKEICDYFQCVFSHAHVCHLMLRLRAGY